MRKKKRLNFEELDISDFKKTKVLDFLREGYNKNIKYYNNIKYYCYKLNEFINNNDSNNLKIYYANFVNLIKETCLFDSDFKVFDIKELNNETLNKIRDFTLIRLSTVERYLEVANAEQKKIEAKIFSETIIRPENDEQYQKELKQKNTKRDLMIKAYNNNESLESFDK